MVYLATIIGGLLRGVGPVREHLLSGRLVYFVTFSGMLLASLAVLWNRRDEGAPECRKMDGSGSAGLSAMSVTG